MTVPISFILTPIVLVLMCRVLFADAGIFFYFSSNKIPNSFNFSFEIYFSHFLLTTKAKYHYQLGSYL